MNKFLVGSAVALALTSTPLWAFSVHGAGGKAVSKAPVGAELWLAQGNSGKAKGNGNGGGNKVLKKSPGNSGGAAPGKKNANAGNGQGNPGKGNAKADTNAAKGKPEHAGGTKQAGNGNGKERAATGNGNAGKSRRTYTTAEREEIVDRLVSTPAPDGRDMRRLIGTTALALATPQLVISDVPEDELITYSNCPPGLAKKDPPCVPPGLARDGVTYDEWASYGEDRYDELWVDRRRDWLGSDFEVEPDPELLLLRSDQIQRLFDLEPAPSGQRYALIDGLPVLLDDEDYDSLLLVNQVSRVPNVPSDLRVAPTAALTQDDLVNLYRLPQRGPDQNYAVVNGQLLQLDDSAYETLQLIRIARAVL
ncbi:hypothetical protein LVO79_14030 [Roseivivax marinus]|uniref:hypothetical protein n=2 Tax=Roseivivax marinus TaxID=1379903 RepID=UPI001F049155|nr:hypothetical protein [Roseivivax marinus]UMA64132.1 hypothetical protein LVO79_14030 [Roseivivax marinus]